ncbi:MAG: hypothetical protein M9947_17560 [Thermomicrobiales bacterium]|nr:hypothetical protein [Thermomicrobiales bacterium]
MRFARFAFLLVLLAALSMTKSFPAAGAQDSATPEAATPVATDTLSGRLGGTLDSILDRFGEPDFTGDGYIRYDTLDLNGNSTILVIYHDAPGTVTRFAFVYPVRPETPIEPERILDLAANMAPTDGVCQGDGIDSAFGSEVYPCHSNALMTVFDAERLAELNVSGGLGDYSVVVDPLDDDWFEIIVIPGTDGAALAEEPAPADDTDPATLLTLEEQYPELDDAESLMDGAVALGTPMSFTGVIKTLQIAEFGTQYRLGEDQSLGVSSLFQVVVPNEMVSNAQVLFVGYNGDATDLAIGDRVTVYGALYGTQCFDNQLDVEVCQPLIAADLVEEADGGA